MAVWAVVKNRSSVLLVKRSPHTTRAGQWCLPGGSVKADEILEAACIREVKEETQLSIRIVNRVIGLESAVKKDTYFCCELVGSVDSIQLKQNECVDYVWANPHRLLEVGTIMNLKAVVPVLRSLGYSVELSDELERYVFFGKGKR